MAQETGPRSIGQVLFLQAVRDGDTAPQVPASTDASSSSAAPAAIVLSEAGAQILENAFVDVLLPMMAGGAFPIPQRTRNYTNEYTGRVWKSIYAFKLVSVHVCKPFLLLHQVAAFGLPPDDPMVDTGSEEQHASLCVLGSVLS